MSSKAGFRRSFADRRSTTFRAPVLAALTLLAAVACNDLTAPNSPERKTAVGTQYRATQIRGTKAASRDSGTVFVESSGTGPAFPWW